MKQTVIDMTHHKFNGCEVLERNGSDKHSRAMWKVLCHCGRTFTTLGNSIRYNRVASCGCTRLEKTKSMGESNKTHGDTLTRLYNTWKDMKARCQNGNHKSYKYYGDRGIGICDEWISSYQKFKEWALDNGYEESLTLDRIDVNGNYTPGNCRWATMKKQGRNRRNNKMMIYEDNILTQSEISEKTGLSKYQVGKRYDAISDLEVHP